jgi:hypothetical protein
MNEHPNWEQLEADVVRKIRLLRAAWEHTTKNVPEVHEVMKRDLYIPAVEQLAAFCLCVEEEDDFAHD